MHASLFNLFSFRLCLFFLTVVSQSLFFHQLVRRLCSIFSCISSFFQSLHQTFICSFLSTFNFAFNFSFLLSSYHSLILFIYFLLSVIYTLISDFRSYVSLLFCLYSHFSLPQNFPFLIFLIFFILCTSFLPLQSGLS